MCGGDGVSVCRPMDQRLSFLCGSDESAVDLFGMRGCRMGLCMCCVMRINGNRSLPWVILIWFLGIKWTFCGGRMIIGIELPCRPFVLLQWRPLLLLRYSLSCILPVLARVKPTPSNYKTGSAFLCNFIRSSCWLRLFVLSCGIGTVRLNKEIIWFHEEVF